METVEAQSKSTLLSCHQKSPLCRNRLVARRSTLQCKHIPDVMVSDFVKESYIGG